MTMVQVTAGRATPTASNGFTLTPTNYGSAQDYTGVALVEPVQVEEWQTDAPPDLRRPVLAGGMVGASPPASVALCSGTPATTTAR